MGETFLKKVVGLLVGILLVLSLIPGSVLAGELPYKEIVVFGDELSEDLPPTTQDDYDPDDDNGLSWVSLWAKKYGLLESRKNPESEGCRGERNFSMPDASIEYFHNHWAYLMMCYRSQLPGDALYVIALGANNVRKIIADWEHSDSIRKKGCRKLLGCLDALDYDVYNRAEKDKTLKQTVTDLRGWIISMMQHGANNILVVNVPNLYLFPKYRKYTGPLDQLNTSIIKPDYEEAFLAGKIRLEAVMAGIRSRKVFAVTATFNNKLKNMVDQLQQDSYGLYDIRLMDFNRILYLLISDPKLFGFTNVRDACVEKGVVCAEPDKYLFWSDRKLTAAGQRAVAFFVPKETLLWK
ncbi:MAG: hypothetical protein G8D88_03220 [gamma proteobacterium symbiont of Ctena orbiculata]